MQIFVQVKEDGDRVKLRPEQVLPLGGSVNARACWPIWSRSFGAGYCIGLVRRYWYQVWSRRLKKGFTTRPAALASRALISRGRVGVSEDSAMILNKAFLG